MTSSDKVFVGNANLKEPKPGFKFMQLGLTKDDLMKLSTYLDDKGWVNIKLMTSQKGGHYMEIDTWKFNKDKESASKVDPSDDLPF